MSQLLPSKIPLILIIFPLLFILTKSQLTLQDKNVIENYIFQSQSKNTGLFFEVQEPFKHTKEAISVLNILGLQVKHSKEICKNLSETGKIDANIVEIDKQLKCKIDFTSYKPDFSKQKLVDLYHEAQIMDMLNFTGWEELFKKTKLKEEVEPLLQKSVDSLVKSNAVLSDDMIVYLEKGVGSYRLNYHVIKAIKLAKKSELKFLR